MVLLQIKQIKKHGICSKNVVIQMVSNPPKMTWLLYVYYNKTMVNFCSGKCV